MIVAPIGPEFWASHCKTSERHRHSTWASQHQQALPARRWITRNNKAIHSYIGYIHRYSWKVSQFLSSSQKWSGLLLESLNANTLSFAEDALARGEIWQSLFWFTVFRSEFWQAPLAWHNSSQLQRTHKRPRFVYLARAPTTIKPFGILALRN